MWPRTCAIKFRPWNVLRARVCVCVFTPIFFKVLSAMWIVHECVCMLMILVGVRTSLIRMLQFGKTIAPNNNLTRVNGILFTFATSEYANCGASKCKSVFICLFFSHSYYASRKIALNMVKLTLITQWFEYVKMFAICKISTIKNKHW